eukprot:1159498-Pelagomonas_calceolata.AAC.5
MHARAHTHTYTHSRRAWEPHLRCDHRSGCEPSWLGSRGGHLGRSVWGPVLHANPPAPQPPSLPAPTGACRCVRCHISLCLVGARRNACHSSSTAAFVLAACGRSSRGRPFVGRPFVGRAFS